MSTTSNYEKIIFKTEKGVFKYSVPAASFKYETLGYNDIIVYIEYTKGSEDKITITFDVFNKTLGEWYPIQILFNGTITTYSIDLTDSGKYRIITITGANERFVKINVEYVNLFNYSTAGTITLFAQPNSPWKR